MSQTVEFMLPTKPSEVTNLWGDQTFGMIGAAGIGKSEFWSHGEKTLYGQTEAGLSHLSVMKIPLNSWVDVCKFMSALTKAQTSGNYLYDTIVIDTIDKLVTLAEGDVIEKIKGRFPDKASNINSLFDYPAASNAGNPAWGWRTERVFKVLDRLNSLPSATVFIGHLGSKEVNTPTSKMTKETITIGGQLGASLVHWPNHFMNITGGIASQGRKVRSIPTATVEAKSRGGIIPDGWLWDADSKINYDKLRSMFT